MNNIKLFHYWKSGLPHMFIIITYQVDSACQKTQRPNNYIDIYYTLQCKILGCMVMKQSCMHYLVQGRLLCLINLLLLQADQPVFHHSTKI